MGMSKWSSDIISFANATPSHQSFDFHFDLKMILQISLYLMDEALSAHLCLYCETHNDCTVSATSPHDVHSNFLAMVR